jgi:hypothetical protein
MSALTIQVELEGFGEVDAVLQTLRNSLARRGPMHARMAVRAMEETQDHLGKDQSHNTANRLGANPTGFRKKSAARVTAQSDEDEGRVVIPRNTGLGRAFGDVEISPGPGRTYLPIPAHQTTYGHSPRDGFFPEDTFHFAVINSWRVFLALVFTAGPYKGEVGFWLKRKVNQKQDRSLLPSNERYTKVARLAAVEYLTNLIENPNSPAGGTSSGMPSAF